MTISRNDENRRKNMNVNSVPFPRKERKNDSSEL